MEGDKRIRIICLTSCVPFYIRTIIVCHVFDFFSRFRIMGQHFIERKKKAGGVRGREFKNTTNINREKKERKEVLDFFFFYRKLVKQKERYTFLFWFIEKCYTFFQKSVALYFFPFFGERNVTPRSRRGQPLG